jgi:hypothetical protein
MAQDGRAIRVIATLLGFIVWWPIGLVLLVSQIWSGRMSCWTYRHERAGSADGRGWTPPWAGWWGPADGRQADARPGSGNRAFDEYRAETLRRLEEEQREFGDFLERLRFARDKSEFDQFMTERRQRAGRPPEPPTDDRPGPA